MGTDIIETATRRCPSLLYAAMGLWLAWTFLVFSSSVWIDGSEVDSSASTNVFLFSTIGFLSACTLSAAKPHLVGRAFQDKRFFAVVGLMAALACAAVILCGPRFLLRVSYAAALVVSLTCAVITGVGTSLIAARCMQLLSVLPPRRIFHLVVCNVLLACAVYFVVVSLASPLCQIAFCLLPLAAALLVRSNLDVDASTSPNPAPTASETVLSGKLFRRFCIMITILTFALSIVRQENAYYIQPTVVQSYTDASMVLRIVIGLILLLCILNITNPETISKLYYGVLLVVVFVPLIAAIFSLESGMLSFLIAGFYTFFEMMIFSILARLATKSGADALIAYGHGWGFLTLGGLLGYLVGTYVPLMLPMENIALILALIVTVCCVPVALFVFTGRDFDTLIEDCIGSDEFADFELSTAALASDAAAAAPTPSREELLDQFARTHGLSARESEVAKLILRGNRPDEIANGLYLSINTVRRHTQNIYVKVEVHSREELFEAFFAETGHSPFTL